MRYAASYVPKVIIFDHCLRKGGGEAFHRGRIVHELTIGHPYIRIGVDRVEIGQYFIMGKPVAAFQVDDDLILAAGEDGLAHAGEHSSLLFILDEGESLSLVILRNVLFD